MASPDRLAAAMRFLSYGEWGRAEAAARDMIQEDPADSPACLVLGLAVAAMGDAARAAPLLVHIAALVPDIDHPCIELARLRPPVPRPRVAQQFRACLRLTPLDDRLRLAFAAFLLDNDQAEEAEACLALCAQSAASHHLKGLAHAELSRFPSAIGSFQRAIACDPDAAPNWSNLGMMLKVEGRFKEAVAAHDRAVALDGANPRFRVNRAIALLKAGDWARGWQEYEARFDLPGALSFEPKRLMPSLGPNDGAAGYTVLVVHEEGFGDTIQLLRYLPLLALRGARVIVRVPGKLGQLTRQVPGVTAVVTDFQPLPAYDFVCPMLSLPRVFGATADTIPPVPIAFDAALARRWAKRIPTSRTLRVGLVWAGQARPTVAGFSTLDARRSIPLDLFAPLFEVAGVSFVSLQTGAPSKASRPAQMAMTDVMSDVADFADTAAIIHALDVVISVDTAVVHLAGLMEKPVFMLDRYDGCWRWLSGRTDSPWYPNLTIFRQDQPNDWSGPIARVAASLEAMALYRGFGRPRRRLRRHASAA